MVQVKLTKPWSRRWTTGFLMSFPIMFQSPELREMSTSVSGHHRVLHPSFPLISKTAWNNLREGKPLGRGDQSSSRPSTTSLLLSRRSFCWELLLGLRHHVALRKMLLKSDTVIYILALCTEHRRQVERKSGVISWSLASGVEFSSLLCTMNLGQSSDRASHNKKLCCVLSRGGKASRCMQLGKAIALLVPALAYSVISSWRRMGG